MTYIAELTCPWSDDDLIDIMQVRVIGVKVMGVCSLVMTDHSREAECQGLWASCYITGVLYAKFQNAKFCFCRSFLF